MKPKVYFLIAFRILLLIGIPMCLSLVDWHRIFDDAHDGQTHEWNYSTAHCWAVVGFVMLFILSIVDSVVFTVDVIKGNYDTSKW